MPSRSSSPPMQSERPESLSRRETLITLGVVVALGLLLLPYTRQALHDTQMAQEQEAINLLTQRVEQYFSVKGYPPEMIERGKAFSLTDNEESRTFYALLTGDHPDSAPDIVMDFPERWLRFDESGEFVEFIAPLSGRNSPLAILINKENDFDQVGVGKYIPMRVFVYSLGRAGDAAIEEGDSLYTTEQ